MDYTLTLLRSETIARDTLALYFTKPLDFTYRAGQSIDLTLTHPDESKETRSCTIASAPYEEHIMIAMRIRNTMFKRLLKNLKVGANVAITGPYGSFIMDSKVRFPIVFVTGGIGVTPAYSMIRETIHENTTRKLILIDSNHRPEDAPFLKELTKLNSNHDTFSYIPTMTQADKAWTGKRGRIDEALLQSVIPNMATPLYYTCGSMSMVYYLRQLLKKLGVSPEKILSEDFPGY